MKTYIGQRLLTMASRQRLEMPAGAKPFAVTANRDPGAKGFVLWFTFPQLNPFKIEPRQFVVAGLSDELPDDLAYIGTVYDRSAFTWHIFECPTGGDNEKGDGTKLD